VYVVDDAMAWSDPYVAMMVNGEVGQRNQAWQAPTTSHRHRRPKPMCPLAGGERWGAAADRGHIEEQACYGRGPLPPVHRVGMIAGLSSGLAMQRRPYAKGKHRPRRHPPDHATVRQDLFGNDMWPCCAEANKHTLFDRTGRP